MKNRFIKWLVALFTCVMLLAFGVACDGMQENKLTFTTLTVQENSVYGKLSNATTEFSFASEIQTSGKADFQVAKDAYGTQTYLAKVVPLEEGDNTYYIFEMNGTEVVKTYTVILHRNEMYSVTFDMQGGTEIDPQQVEEEGVATMPDITPERAGYTFVDWNFDFTQPITDNVTVTPNWDANEVTLTVVYGNGQPDTVITQDCDTPITESIENPEKVGYTFTGWDKTMPTIMPVENTTVTALWDINQYTLTIVYGNGQPNKEITKDYNSAITESIVNPERVGYTFDGWDKTIPTKMPINGATVTATWKAIFTLQGETVTGLTAHGRTLADIVIPAKIDDVDITAIDTYAFAGCDNITSISIPVEVESIGAFAFTNCANLTDIYYNGMETQWANVSVGESVVNTSVTLHYKDGTKEDNWTLNDGKTLEIRALNLGLGVEWLQQAAETYNLQYGTNITVIPDENLHEKVNTLITSPTKNSDVYFTFSSEKQWVQWYASGRIYDLTKKWVSHLFFLKSAICCTFLILLLDLKNFATNTTYFPARVNTYSTANSQKQMPIV